MLGAKPTLPTKVTFAGIASGGVVLIIMGAFVIHVGFGLIALGAACVLIGVAIAAAPD